MPYALMEDLRLYYEDSGEGRPLLLLEGALGAIDLPFQTWDPYVAELSQHFRVIRVEHRGHGRSNHPGGEFSYRQFGRDFAAFIEQLELAPAIVAGISDGGVAALNLGLIRPEFVWKIIAIGAHLESSDQPESGAADEIGLLGWWGDPDAFESQDPELAAIMAEHHDRGGGPGWWRELVWLVADIERDVGYDADALRGLNLPVLLIIGDRDEFIGLDQAITMYRALPNAQLLVVSGGGHFCFASHDQIIAPAIRMFLDDELDATAPH